MPNQSAKQPATRKQEKQVVIHPILFALNPIVYNFAQVFAFVEITAALRTTVLSVAGASLLWALMRFLLGDLRKAALSTSLASMLFFAYLAITQKLAEFGLFPDDDWSVGPHLAAILAGVALWIGVALLLARRPLASGWTYFANVFGTVAVIFPLAVVIQSAFVASRVGQTVEWHHRNLPTAGEGAIEEPPDIYWIIPDGYPRADVLADFFDYDDQPFLNELRERGFRIPTRSVSHYSKTVSSVASTLNFDYMQDLVSGDIEHVFDWRWARTLLSENRVARFLATRGYRSYSVQSQYDNLSWYSDDVTSRWWFLNYFEVRMVGRSPVPALSRMAGFPILYEHHRARTRQALEWAADAASLPGPKIVFVQVVTPHPPFIFGPDGEDINPPQRYAWSEGLGFQNKPGGSLEKYRTGYLKQVKSLHKPLLEVVDGIQRNSERPPIIMILSDHGSASGDWLMDLSSPEGVERFGMLCALSLPGVDTDAIPDDLAAVNIFRLIFNLYFDTKLDMLEPKYYFLEGDLPYYYLPVDWQQDTHSDEHHDLETATLDATS